MGLLKINAKTLKMNSKEIVLAMLFVVYFILGYPVPHMLAEVLDTFLGQVLVFFVVVLLFLSSNPIIGVLGLLVAIDLLRRSAQTTGSDVMAKYLPSEQSKMSEFNAYNQFPETLEQEMVKIRTVNKDVTLPPASYKPVLEDDHNASKVSQSIL